MDAIEPTNLDIGKQSQVKKYSRPLRLWHWLNAIVISGSLITVLLNSTLTNSRKNADVIHTQLQKAGANVTADQARIAAHALSDKTWDVHVLFGYGLAILLLFRLILEFFEVADQKFIRKAKNAWHQFKTIKKQREEARHELAVKLIYAVFYLLLIIMVLTGLFLAFEDALVNFKQIRHSVKEVHGFCMYLVLAFIVVHLVGVFLAERKQEGKNIVSGMINGGGD